MEPVPYTQRVRPARLGIMLALLALVFGLIGASANFAGAHWGLTGIFAAFMLAMVGLAGAFWELRLEVSPGGVLATWGGVFTRRAALADIIEAAVVSYPARRFMGWGYRWSRGDWALGDLGCPGALMLKLATGKSLYVTLRDPAAALAAVNAAKATPVP